MRLHPSGREVVDSPLIDIYNLRDIKCANPQITFSEESLAGAEVIARTIRGTACGFAKALGNGTLIHLGTWIGFDTEGHQPAYEAILAKSGANLRQASSSNGNIAVRERFTNDLSAVLFAGNYYNEQQAGTVAYTHPGSGETITIPYSGETMVWPPLYSILTPVCMEVAPGLRILHSTSDILGISATNGHLVVTLFGDRDLAGEIVFEGEGVHMISSVLLDGAAVETVRDGKRMVFNYPHHQNIRMTLNVITS